MKLVSLNVERYVHTDKVFPFLLAESADVICLQEAIPEYQTYLESLGYTTHFEPRCIHDHDSHAYIDGLLFASKIPAEIVVHGYFKPGAIIEREVFDHETERNPTPRHVIVGTIYQNQVPYTFATTHFTWTKDGDVGCDAQAEDMKHFMSFVQTLPPHVMCGDFNIPRGYNQHYTTLREFYQDEIPLSYTTSLDAAHHRLQRDPLQSEKVNRYLVDYIFQTGGYEVSSVELRFGVSDHAALVAEVGRV
jgi:endonuclease/exonuclease/phosphatase family metal-dependent hydrolase